MIERQIEILEDYKSFISEIREMSAEKQKVFLDAILKQEIFDNHAVEKTDPFFIQLGLNGNKETAIEYLLDAKEMDPSTLIKAHQIVLKGTDSEEYYRRKYRQDNSTFVTKSGIYNGEPQIHYFAIDYQDIPEALNKTCEYYNGQIHGDNVLIKPIITHGIIAGLQMFDDGNTRLARTVQNTEIFDMSQKNKEIMLKKPVLFNSGSFKIYQEQYRNLVGNLVISENNEAWNKRIDFNLNRIEDQLNINKVRVKTYSRRHLI